MKFPKLPGIIGKIFGGQDKALAAAKKLLKGRVHLPKEVYKALSMTVPKALPDVLVGNSVEDIERCAEENARMGELWTLVFKPEASLAVIRASSPGSFCPASVWDVQPAWAVSSSRPCYRLVNLKLERWRASPGGDPHAVVTARARLCTGIVAVMARKAVGENPLADCFQCSETLPDGAVPIVGAWEKGGMLVTTLPIEALRAIASPGSEGADTFLAMSCCVPRA